MSISKIENYPFDIFSCMFYSKTTLTTGQQKMSNSDLINNWIDNPTKYQSDDCDWPELADKIPDWFEDWVDYLAEKSVISTLDKMQ